MMKLVSEWKPADPEKAEFILETNGSLFTKENGYHQIVLYAITDIAKALVKVLDGRDVKVEYVYDRNTKERSCASMRY